MNFLDVTTLRELVEKPQKIIESDIKAYLVFLRNKKKVSYNTAVLYLSVIKKFYIVNTDYQIKWNLINMYLGNDNIFYTISHYQFPDSSVDYFKYLQEVENLVKSIEFIPSIEPKPSFLKHSTLKNATNNNETIEQNQASKITTSNNIITDLGERYDPEVA